MVKLRGHHLLCLHGFRGLGYSPEFVANMQSIQSQLRSAVEVEVSASPDDVCAACPHLTEHGCRRDSPDSEAEISSMDSLVLGAIGLAPGDRRVSSTLFAMAADEFCMRLDEICSACEWLDAGWCAQGLRDHCMSGGPGMKRTASRDPWIRPDQIPDR